MKKIFAFVIAIMMFVIAGCQCTNNALVEPVEETVEVVDTTCNMQPVDTLVVAPVEVEEVAE